LGTRRQVPLLVVVVLATVPGQSQERAPWLATFQLGVSHWPGLRDVAIPPSGYEVLDLGHFQTNGGNLEMGVYRAHRMASNQELQVGGEFGVWWHRSNNRVTFTNIALRSQIQAEPAANGGHLTGSARMVWTGQRVVPFLGLGAGWYMLVFKETMGDMVVDTSARANAPGGFLTAGVEVRGASPFAFRADTQVHFASFGGSALRGQSVHGPIYTLRIGGSMKF
jgi:hypothetical protein